MSQPTRKRFFAHLTVVRRFVAVLTALAFAGCAQYASVSERTPQYRPAGSTAAFEQGIANGLKEQQPKPLVAIGELLTAAEAASQQLARNPNDKDARDAYNFAVARVFGTIKQAKLDPWTQPLRVHSSGGEYVLTNRPDSLRRQGWNPALYDFMPTDQFEVTGTYVSEHKSKEGLGAPLVVEGRDKNKWAAADFTTPKIFYGVTAVIHFQGGRAEVAFEDPLATERVTMGGRSFPLAADFTVPLAVALARTNPKKMELSRLMNPGKYAETARIARLQPYDPNKTVVLVIHGLKDSPATWAPMLNHLRADEHIRQNYQFWFYSYPSGYPYPHSAAILRRELDAIQKRFPLKKKMVVIGHSMGGCISRLLITDTGDKLWLETFGKPPGEVDMSATSKQRLIEALVFQHRPEIGRVIFISAPLRGADMASNWAGRLGSMLVRMPANLLSAGADVAKFATFQGDELRLTRIPNSIDTLAPNNRFVRKIQKYPLASGIPYHTICGDRGKGGNHDKTPPVASDGVVPYWSSHLDGAQSELVVASHHSAHQNPEAIKEVYRILKLHR